MNVTTVLKQLATRTALVIVAATALAGCTRYFFDWNTRTFRHSLNETPKLVAPPPAPVRNEYVPPRPQTASVHKHKHKKPVSAADVKEMSIQPETTQASPLPPPPPSSISMATPSGSSDMAEKQIETARERLAHFDRNHLSGPTLATYDQASGFLNQGAQALSEKDYVAASGFAQKASALTDQLQATVTAR